MHIATVFFFLLMILHTCMCLLLTMFEGTLKAFEKERKDAKSTSKTQESQPMSTLARRRVERTKQRELKKDRYM